MPDLQFVELQKFDAETWMALLNLERIRHHLMPHPMFDGAAVQVWLESKLRVDEQIGCRVRAIALDEQLVGWCGIQAEADHYELAAVVDPASWGIGRSLLRQLLTWSSELGHSEVALHLLHTRRKYRFLERRAQRIESTQVLGNSFVTYWLSTAKYDLSAN